MKLSEWIRQKIKKREEKKLERLARSHAEEVEEPQPLEETEAPLPPEEAEERRPLEELKVPRPLEEANPEIEPAASRFTDEYQAFLKRLEAEREGIRKEVEEIGRENGEENGEENGQKEDEEG